MTKQMVYAMRKESGHTMCLMPTLDRFVEQIITLSEKEKGFFEGYKPVVYVEKKDE